MLKKLCKVEIEDGILEKCIRWWDSESAQDYDYVVEHESKYMLNLLQVFREYNDKFLLKHDKVSWAKIETLLRDLEVNIDMGDLELEDQFDEACQLLESMWEKLRGAMI